MKKGHFHAKIRKNVNSYHLNFYKVAIAYTVFWKTDQVSLF